MLWFVLVVEELRILAKVLKTAFTHLANGNINFSVKNNPPVFLLRGYSS
jgi:hypothetical protein